MRCGRVDRWRVVVVVVPSSPSSSSSSPFSSSSSSSISEPSSSKSLPSSARPCSAQNTIQHRLASRLAKLGGKGPSAALRKRACASVASGGGASAVGGVGQSPPDARSTRPYSSTALSSTRRWRYHVTVGTSLVVIWSSSSWCRCFLCFGGVWRAGEREVPLWLVGGERVLLDKASRAPHPCASQTHTTSNTPSLSDTTRHDTQTNNTLTHTLSTRGTERERERSLPLPPSSPPFPRRSPPLSPPPP